MPMRLAQTLEMLPRLSLFTLIIPCGFSQKPLLWCYLRIAFQVFALEEKHLCVMFLLGMRFLVTTLSRFVFVC